jgi:outer membrane protein
MIGRVLRVAAALALAIPAIATPARADLKIGIVDLRRALHDSVAGKKAQEQFSAEFERANTSFNGEKDRLERSLDDLEKQKVVLKPEERKSKADELERKKLELKHKAEDLQAELQKKDNELTSKIFKDIAEVIQEIGERDGYTVILENSSSGVLYGAKTIDMTDEVIRAFDAKKTK